MRVPILLLALFRLALLSFPSPAQTSVPEQIARAQELLGEGQTKAAIALLEPMVQKDGNGLPQSELGLVWNLLGSSYQDLEMFAKARTCYQTSVEILRPLPSAQARYAAAIANLASLEDSTGQKDSSRMLWEKANHIYESLDNLGGIAISSTNLAMLSYTRKDFKAARRYLATAEQQAKRTTDLGDDDIAELLSMHGALAFHDGRYQEALATIQQAIDHYTHAHGQNYFMLGLAYALRAQTVAKCGDYERAIADARHALAIIDAAEGRNNTAYFQVEIVYAQILRASGDKEQSSGLEKQAKSSLAALLSRQCNGCTINASGFR